MKLTLDLATGPITVNARKVGPLAVHESMWSKPQSGWHTITHIATGRLVCLMDDSEDAAVRLARRLAKLDWSRIKTPRSHTAIERLRPKVNAIIGGWKGEAK